MKRREFIAALGAVMAPASLHGGQMQRIAMLMGLPAGDEEGQRWVRRFIQGLREFGWRNGTNVQIDLRWAGDVELMRSFAQELLELRPDVIHVTTGLATAEVLRKTSNVPVVFSVVNDPVGLGFVQSLSRPGGNATGFTNVDASLGNKWLQLIKEIAPRVARVAVLFNPVPGSQFKYRWAQLETFAASLNIAAEAVEVTNLAEIEKAFGRFAESPQIAVIVAPDPFFNLSRAGFITSLVSRHRIVALYPFRDFVIAGGLVSYSVHIPDLQRRAAGYVDRILKGESPADLPVQGPIKHELAINMKTAKALGLAVPRSLIARADEVIE